MQVDPNKQLSCDSLDEDAFYITHSDGVIENLFVQKLAARSPSPKPPDISQGLGKRKGKRDLVILERFVADNLPLMVYHGKLHIYDPPRWRMLDSQQAMAKIRAVLEPNDCLTERDYKEILDSLLVNPRLQVEEELHPPENKLNLLDGTYDLTSQQFLPHDPQDHFFTYINARFRDADHCSGNTFESFIENISNGDPNIRTQLLELVALTILGKQVKHFFVLLGPSNTGKTQFGRFLEELIGRENVECIRDVKDFSGRWTTGSLEGKMLATCLDLPDGPMPLSAVGIIKQFVGDDPIKGERKYKDSFTFYRKPLLLFAGNYPIRIPQIDREQALLNRMVIIPFQNPVAGCDMKQELYKDLLDEAPYIIIQALNAYRALEDRNFQVTRAAIPEELAPQDSRASYHSVSQFLAHFCVAQPGAEVATSDLYNAYKSYNDSCFDELSYTDFARQLGEQLSRWPGVKPVKRVSGQERRGYQGIQLNADNGNDYPIDSPPLC